MLFFESKHVKVNPSHEVCLARVGGRACVSMITRRNVIVDCMGCFFLFDIKKFNNASILCIFVFMRAVYFDDMKILSAHNVYFFQP